MCSEKLYTHLDWQNKLEEHKRLEELSRYKVLDTLPEQSFDDLTFVAAQLCDAPVALVSLVDDHRCFYKSRYGTNLSHVLLHPHSACLNAVRSKNYVEVSNMQKDPRFCQNPYVLHGVSRQPPFVFYAGVPLITPGGYCIGTLCVLDYSQRELTQKQREALICLSRQVVSQLELRLQNEKLEESREELMRKNEELKRLNEVKTKFLGTLSHDARQPINSINVCTELLLEDKNLTDEHAELVECIQSSNGFILHLMEELLQMAVSEDAHWKLNLQTVDIISLIRRNVASNKRIAQKKDIELCLAIKSDQEPITMLLDAPKIEQAVNNLVTNALKFSNPKTKIEITLSLQKLRDGSNVLLSVQDQGQGIPSAELQNIFQAYQKTSVKPTAGENSTGLGLYITKKIVDMHEGEILVQSQVGKGTTFSIVLPVKKTQQREGESASQIITDQASDNTDIRINNNVHSSVNMQTNVNNHNGNNSNEINQHMHLSNDDSGDISEPSTPPITPTSINPDAFQGDFPKKILRVLVVEDNLVNQKLLAKVLSNRGHNVITANNGAEAVEIFRRRSFDVVLTDLEMPVMNGYQAAKIIRAEETSNTTSKKRTPIIMVSGGYRDAKRESGHADSPSQPHQHQQQQQQQQSSAQTPAMESPTGLCEDRLIDCNLPKPYNVQKIIQTTEKFALYSNNRVA